MRLRPTAPVEQAMPLLERFATIGAEVALAEGVRDAAIVGANSAADHVVLPLLEEQAALRAQLEPWWHRTGHHTLLAGKRKTIELGGCFVGTKAGRAWLTFAGGDDKAAVAALQAQRWAKPYVRVTVSIDKVATRKGLEGKHAQQLDALGFGLTEAGEVFVLERVVQDGVVSG